ncbi:TonB-dependent receptor domain-containing protein [Campylobacter sp. JMF_08 NE1]|uniref:TonB-dependent receptor domain-containing protein n=1 Tax=Campylobacter sp. JMF_08 NE1 TaxID=2983821 RepID=UPI0022E9EBD2|nr:TonB-dependent receptor [Campylobacter sp. JMF_08 NE1]MDA3047260.1 TonB-dependent receptor [Campylobacter sp. JMF_08 NE1]
MKKSFYLSLVVAGVLFGVENNATTPKHNAVEFDEIIVSATLTEVENLKYAGSVGVVGEKELKQKSNVIDSIMDIPGVDGGMEMGRESGRQFQIRGFGYQSENRVIIKQDGVPRSPSLYSNHISSFRTDSDILKRVEVTKGASSILHGSGAIGGIVEMSTKDARDYLSEGKEFGAMIGGRLESNNMKSGRAAVYAAPKDIPVDILIYGKKASHGNMKFADGGSKYADPNDPTTKKSFDDEDIRTIFAKVGANLGDNHRLQFSLFDYKLDALTTWQTLWNNYDSLDVKGNLEQRDYVFNYFYTPQNPWLDLELTAYKTESKYHRIYEETEGSGVWNSMYDNDEERWGLNLKNVSRFETGIINHNLVTGFDYQNREEDALMAVDGVSTMDFFSHPNKWQDFGFYLQDIMQVGDLELTLGGRYDKFKREVGVNDADFSDDRFSPRVALSYTFFDKFTLLAGYSESFRAPTPHETSQAGSINRMYYYIPNPDLKSEVAKEYEIGFSFADDTIFSDNDKFSFKGVYFNGKIEDMINIAKRPDLGTPPISGLNPAGTGFQEYGQYQNIEEAKRHGFELSANYEINGFKFGAGYEHLKIYDSKTKEPITNGRHADKLMASFGYKPLSNLSLDLKISHWFSPEIYGDGIYSVNSRTGEVTHYVDKDFTIADFKGEYKIEKSEVLPFLDGATVGFGVNNIFDKPYINANRTRETTAVGRGRNFWVDLEVKF